MKMQRSAGILLPISSLPSPYGIGCFSQEAYDFVDWLKEAGQTYWQILPLGVTSYGDSPYQSFSAFAGNPYFISLDALVEEGVLTAAECKKANFGRKADDIWANPGLFQLDKENLPTAVAGVPPDGFSPTGQLWGNPLYRWEAHRATGYQWWITRLWYCFELYDVVRIDHFRGFDEYFSIPYGSETAVEGHWEKGPGIELFRAVEQALGKREIIAEDLGYMSDTVRQLVRDSGFPGMKVLEFAFDSRDTGSASDYLPHNYPVNSVAYTGTHDNETLVSWYQTVTDAERAMVRDYLYDYATPEEQLYQSMIALILRSAAATCIIPMQDWLGLDNSARINKPSTVGQNWRWRLKKTQLTKKLQKEICQLTARYGRMNWA